MLKSPTFWKILLKQATEILLRCFTQSWPYLKYVLPASLVCLANVIFSFIICYLFWSFICYFVVNVLVNVAFEKTFVSFSLRATVVSQICKRRITSLSVLWTLMTTAPSCISRHLQQYSYIVQCWWVKLNIQRVSAGYLQRSKKTCMFCNLIFVSCKPLIWGMAVLLRAYAFIMMSPLIVGNCRCISRDFLINCK